MIARQRVGCAGLELDRMSDVQEVNSTGNAATAPRVEVYSRELNDVFAEVRPISTSEICYAFA